MCARIAVAGARCRSIVEMSSASPSSAIVASDQCSGVVHVSGQTASTSATAVFDAPSRILFSSSSRKTVVFAICAKISRLGARMCQRHGRKSVVAAAASSARGHARPNFRRRACPSMSHRAGAFQLEEPRQAAESVSPAEAADAMISRARLQSRRANFWSRSRPCGHALPHGATPPPGALRARRAHPNRTPLHKPRRPTRGGRRRTRRRRASTNPPRCALVESATPVQGVVVAQRGGRLRARRDARRRRVQRGAPRAAPEGGQRWR